MLKIISNLIKANGAITIAEFMNEALFHPQHGYYNTHNPLGKKGDFITSPEISQAFGELIGAYLIHIWQNSYHSQEINLVEMGAGQGTLMRDLLNFASKIPNFENRVKVNIIEISPKLTTVQQRKLAKFKVNWFEDFASFYKSNGDKPLFFISNELFDCFAINQFVNTKDGWAERLVTLDENGQLAFSLSTPNPAISDLISKKTPDLNIKIDAFFEHSPSATSFMEELSQAINKNGGIGLAIDYGYIENKFKNTLQAVHNHQYCNVLENVGNIDITALVDFQNLRNIATRNHLETSLVTQKEFLESLGIEIRKENLMLGKSQDAQKEILSAIKRLVDPTQMGELFKCLIFWKA
ncbi:MAG: SAM-dependent methyltransferase [Proteobacteria bacterium]|nr:SAM-dependent methyltransferase [Pseudomonadota bacterium]